LSSTVDPQPLRRLITPLPGEEFRALFSLKPFLKRLAGKQFFEKACDHTYRVWG